MITKNEHDIHCERIARDIENTANGLMYQCPHCGENFNRSEITEENTDESGAQCCPECGNWVQYGDYTADDYAECVSLIDWLGDILSVDVTREGFSKDGDIIGTRWLLTYGGPNIYVDSLRGSVYLYWWSERGSAPLSSQARDALNELAEELSNC